MEASTCMFMVLVALISGCIFGSCLGKDTVYDRSCSTACVQLGEVMDFHENQVCVCTETILTSDLPRMWKPKK